MLWAFAGTAGQIVVIWSLTTGDSSTDPTPWVIWQAAILLNAVAITALMWLEPKAEHSVR